MILALAMPANPQTSASLVAGSIPPGTSCFASQLCTMARDCPVAHGRNIDAAYSCGAARAFAMLNASGMHPYAVYENGILRDTIFAASLDDALSIAREGVSWDTYRTTEPTEIPVAARGIETADYAEDSVLIEPPAPDDT